MATDTRLPTADRRFYQIGGSLHADAPSYVERAADRDLYEALSRGEFCYVLDSRQMGKSSLMVRTARRLQQDGVQVVVCDFTALGENQTAEQWYEGLLGILGHRLNLEAELEEFWLAHPRVGPLRRWMLALREVVLPHLADRRQTSGVSSNSLAQPMPCDESTTGTDAWRLTPDACRLVIFLDEIDVVRSLPFSTDEFFAAIRECYNRRTEDPEFERLTFCLLGVATPSDLIRDTRKTPFNIGRRIELTDFTAAEAAPLAAGLRGEAGRERESERARERESQTLLRRILYWTGGHPYLTQRLCQAVAKASTGNPKSEIQNPKSIDRLCGDLFLSTGARERDDNLIFVRERLFRSEVERAALLDLYAQVRSGRPIADDVTDARVSALRLSGIIRSVIGCLRVRNRIYERVFNREWITRNMPDAELRRQKAAFQRGLLRAASVGGVIVLLMTILVLAAVSQAHRAEAATESERSLRLQLEQTVKAREAALAAERRQHAIATEQTRIALAAQQAERRQFRRAEEARRGREQQRRRAERQERIAAANQAAAKWQRLLADQRREENHARLVRLNVANGNRLVDEGDLLGALPWFVQALALEEGRGEREAVQRMRLAAVLQRCPRLLALLPHARPQYQAEFSPDGRRIVTASLDGTARVWDAATGQPTTPPLKHDGEVHHAAFSPDGRRVVTASRDMTARVWDATTGQPVSLPLRHTGRVEHAVFSPDGQRIVTAAGGTTDGGTGRGEARVWDATTGAPVTAPLPHSGEVLDAEFSPDGRRVVTASRNMLAQVWDTTTGQPIAPPLKHLGFVEHAAFSPDGQRIVTAGQQYAQVWDAKTSRAITPMLRHSGHVGWAEFSPDGRRIVTASLDRYAQVWDAATGQQLVPPLKHGGFVHHAAFSADGRYIVTASADQTARVWDSATGEPVTPPLKDNHAVLRAAFSPDGQRIVTAGFGRAARVWDVSAYQPIATRLEHRADVRAAAFSADGRRIVTASRDRTAQVWDAATGRPITPSLKHDGGVWEAKFSPDGRRILTASDDGTARMWDAVTGQPVTPPLKQNQRVTYAAFSRDGRRIVTASEDQTARVWEAATGRPITPPLKHRGIVWIAAFSRDGRRVVTASDDQTAEIWDAATGRAVTPPLKHSGAVTSVAFSPDGRRVVTASDDLTAGIWDAVTGRRLTSLRHGGLVIDAVFSPDGQRIVTVSFDQRAREWDARTGRLLHTLNHRGPVQHAAFSADGRRIVTSSRDQTARVWDAATGEPITPPLEHAGWVWHATFSPDGRHIVTASAGRGSASPGFSGTAQVWALPLDTRPVADLRRLVEWLTAQRIGGTSGAATLETAEALQTGKALRTRYPAEFAPSPTQVQAWHDREARGAEVALDWLAALPHLDALVAARPTDAGLRGRRGTAHAELGHWEKAVADFMQAVTQEPDHVPFRLSLALAQLAAGDTDGYRQQFAVLLDRLRPGDPFSLAPQVLWTSVVLAEPVTDAARLVALAERAVASSRGISASEIFLVTLGAALYRAGRLQEAVQQLTEANASSGGEMAPHWLFLAMAHARLGDSAQARQWLEKSRAPMDEQRQRKPWENPSSWGVRLMFERLRREAETLLQPGSPKGG